MSTAAASPSSLWGSLARRLALVAAATLAVPGGVALAKRVSVKPAAGTPTVTAKPSGPFQGTLELTMTGPQTAGITRISASPAGIRSDMALTAPAPMKTTVIIKASEPNRAVRLDDKEKTYRDIDIAAAHAETRKAAPADAAYSVKPLGTEPRLGLKCLHVMATSDRGDTLELWTTDDLVDGVTLSHVLRPTGLGESPALMRALHDAGADGFQVKAVRRDGAATQTIELVKVDRSPVTASTFEVPPGYKKSDVAVSATVRKLNPEDAAKIEKAAAEDHAKAKAPKP